MFTDIIFPAGNEEEFIGMAKKLNMDGLLFCYNFDSFFLKPREKRVIDGIKVEYGIIIGHQKIDKAKNKNYALLCNSNERAIFDIKFEEKTPLVLYELEGIARNDSLHSRHSGLNHILCSLMKKNSIVLGFSLSQVLNASPLKRAYILGRMMQNIRFARKYNVKMKMASFARTPYEMRAYRDMISLGTILGMHPIEAKKALE